MKILAFSDLHRDKNAARSIVEHSADADVVVGCGDFATKRVGALETLHILAEIAVPIVVVHGNHDDPSEINAFCNRSKHLHYLHGTDITFDGMSFVGLGGEVPSRSDAPWNAVETEARAAERLADMPSHSVLVTHTPPLGVADLQSTGEHEGSVAIRDAITRSRPRLALCGHIHRAWGMEGQIGPTYVKNLGPSVNWFDL